MVSESHRSVSIVRETSLCTSMGSIYKVLGCTPPRPKRGDSIHGPNQSSTFRNAVTYIRGARRPSGHQARNNHVRRCRRMAQRHPKTRLRVPVRAGRRFRCVRCGSDLGCGCCVNAVPPSDVAMCARGARDRPGVIQSTVH